MPNNTSIITADPDQAAEPKNGNLDLFYSLYFVLLESFFNRFSYINKEVQAVSQSKG
jgi:hypothetical protein